MFLLAIHALFISQYTRYHLILIAELARDEPRLSQVGGGQVLVPELVGPVCATVSDFVSMWKDLVTLVALEWNHYTSKPSSTTASSANYYVPLLCVCATAGATDLRLCDCLAHMRLTCDCVFATILATKGKEPTWKHVVVLLPLTIWADSLRVEWVWQHCTAVLARVPYLQPWTHFINLATLRLLTCVPILRLVVQWRTLISS